LRKTSAAGAIGVGIPIGRPQPALQLGIVDAETFDRVVDSAKMVRPYVATAS
jgi:hypothetical protein